MLSSSSNSVEGGLLVETFGPASPDVDGALVKDFLGLVLDVFLGLVGPPVVVVVLDKPVVEAEPASGTPPFCCTASAGLGNEVTQKISYFLL